MLTKKLTSYNLTRKNHRTSLLEGKVCIDVQATAKRMRRGLAVFGANSACWMVRAVLLTRL